MAGRAGRRALSPLIASVILIAVTIVGGLLVYQYFQRSSEALIAAGETMFIKVSDVLVDANNRLVYIEVTNGYDNIVTILDAAYFDAQGNRVDLGLNINAQVEPGGKYTITAVVPSNAVAVAVVYSVDGEILVTEPAPLR
jgi:flagellin-like protein